MTLQEKLGETYRAKGLEATLTRYQPELRERYLLQKEDVEAAIAILKLNAEYFPESANVWDGFAEGYMNSRDLAVAKNTIKSLLSSTRRIGMQSR